MNKRLVALLLASASTLALADALVTFNPDSECECKATSKTFFSARPAYQLNSPEFLASFHDRLGARGKDCRNGALEVAIFGGRSTKPDNFSSYFMPDCQTRLHVTSFISDTAGTEQPFTNVIAPQLNIFTQADSNASITPFESYIEFNPHYSFAGFGMTYKQEFATSPHGRAFWFLVSAPITTVKTSMELTEQVVHDGGGADLTNFPGSVANATEAFAQSGWNFGLIEQCAPSKTSLGDITLLGGYEIIRHELCSADGYVGVIIPTGNKVKGKKVFEPIVGHNHHFGVLTGSSANVFLWQCDNRSLSFQLDGHVQYLFARCETRSFDLKNKPWSRYMQVYANKDQAQEAYNLFLADSLDAALQLGTPGINVFTQPLRVHPGYAYINNMAMLYDHCDWQFEVGYNFYARQAECVELSRPWQTGPALKSFKSGAGNTDSVQTISNDYSFNNSLPFLNATTGANQYDQNLIQATDLDLASAAHPAVLSNTIYGAASYRLEECEHPSFVGLGGSYEFQNDNTTMNRWNVWLKGGVSF